MIREDLSIIEYEGTLDWLIKLENPIPFLQHKSYILCQLIVIFGGILGFVHAVKSGGRWKYFYVASLLHGLTVELVSYFVPHIDNFWQSQSPLIFFGRRLPLYIIFLYPVFYYHSQYAVSKLGLKCPIARYLCAGILTVLIDIPYDIIGIKYLHWTWHDTDPNIGDRSYWVPWNSYYFHACFAASFSFLFHQSRKWFDKRNLKEWETGTIKSEIGSVVVSSLLSMPCGCLLFLPLYHPFHDFFNVHSELTTLTILIVFTVIVWRSDRNSIRTKKPKLNGISIALLIHLFLHYFVFWITVILFNPDDIIVTGLYEPVGNCSEKIPLHTLLTTLEKRKYLCASDYDEKYFDFHCRKNQEQPENGLIWYTICGTKFENKAEYILLLSLIFFVGTFVFGSIHLDWQNDKNENKNNKIIVEKTKRNIKKQV